MLAHDRPGERFPRLGRQWYAQAVLTLEQGPEEWIVGELAFETRGVRIDPEHPDRSPMRGESAASIDTDSNRTVMERDFDQRGLTVDEQSFVQAVGKHPLADTQGIAAVKIEDFAASVSRGRMQHKLADRAEAGIRAVRQSGACQKLLMKGGRALESGAGGGVRRLNAGFEQTADVLDADAPQKCPRRFVPVLPEKAVESGSADAGNGADRRNIGKGGRVLAHPGKSSLEESLVPFLAPVKPIGMAAMARTEPAPARFVGRTEEPDVLPPGTARGTRRKTVDARGQNAGEELAVVCGVALQKVLKPPVVVHLCFNVTAWIGGGLPIVTVRSLHAAEADAGEAPLSRRFRCRSLTVTVQQAPLPAPARLLAIDREREKHVAGNAAELSVSGTGRRAFRPQLRAPDRPENRRVPAVH